MNKQTSEPLALGFDIGGTSTKIGLVSPAGMISHFRRFPTEARDASPQRFLQRLVENVGSVIEEAGDRHIVGIGISVHGYTDEDRTGPILCLNTPALHGVNLKGLMQDRFNLPTVVNNDLTAHVLAEYVFGSGQGARRFLCMAIGTGLGAGVVINGEPLRFVGGCAGDTGHIILEPGGLTCSAGCKGCAEALCGVSGIEHLAFERYGRKVSAYQVIEAAQKGSDPIATGIIQQIGHYIGQTLASLAAIFLPDRIALTGGTAEAGAVLLDAVCSRFEELVGDYHRVFAAMGGDYYSGVEIVLGKTRGETGVIGATVELLQPYLTQHDMS